MATKSVTDGNFETDVIKSEKPTVVDFWAEWCGPCKQIGPALEEISEEMKDQVIIANTTLTKNLILQQNMELKVYQRCYYLREES